MKYLTIIFIIFCFFKSLSYSLFEIEEKNNKPGGIAIIFLSILGLIISTNILLFLY